MLRQTGKQQYYRQQYQLMMKCEQMPGETFAIVKLSAKCCYRRILIQGREPE